LLFSAFVIRESVTRSVWNIQRTWRRRGRNIPFCEHRNPNHTDFSRGPRSSNIGVRDRRKSERCGLPLRQPPTIHIHVPPCRHQIAAFLPIICRLPIHYVPAIYRHHSLDSLAGMIVDPQRVSLAALTHDIGLTMVVIRRGLSVRGDDLDFVGTHMSLQG
jgi:hypothetical protein